MRTDRSTAIGSGPHPTRSFPVGPMAPGGGIVCMIAHSELLGPVEEDGVQGRCSERSLLVKIAAGEADSWCQSRRSGARPPHRGPSEKGDASRPPNASGVRPIGAQIPWGESRRNARKRMRHIDGIPVGPGQDVPIVTIAVGRAFRAIPRPQPTPSSKCASAGNPATNGMPPPPGNQPSGTRPPHTSRPEQIPDAPG